MPIPNFNAGFGSDDPIASDDDLNEVDAGENEENLKEELDEEAEEDESVPAEVSPFAEASGDKSEDEGFDLDEEDDLKVLPPIFAPAAVNPLVADDEESDEQTEDDEVDEEMEAGEDDDEDDVEERDLTEDEDEEDSEEGLGDESMVISKSKIILANQLLRNIKENSDRLVSLFGGQIGEGDEERISIGELSDGLIDDEEEGGRVIEGVFNGENMIGPDGKEYAVPANYASKSKLVEGDMLKLTITDRGTFIYKQTKPVERKRLIGKLEKDGNGNYLVKAEHKKFRVITASITYYKGIQGDKVVILVPIAGDSAWGAVDNVIKSK